VLILHLVVVPAAARLCTWVRSSVVVVSVTVAQWWKVTGLRRMEVLAFAVRARVWRAGSMGDGLRGNLDLGSIDQVDILVLLSDV
jgi:hypothetical protein